MPRCLYAYLFIYLIPTVPFAVNTVNIVDILILQIVLFVLYCIVLLHIPLGIATFSFHCRSCICMWQVNFLIKGMN